MKKERKGRKNGPGERKKKKKKKRREGKRKSGERNKNEVSGPNSTLKQEKDNKNYEITKLPLNTNLGYYNFISFFHFQCN